MHHYGWKEEKSIGTVLEWTLNDFAVFVAEFWKHVGVINKSPAEYVDLSLEDALKIIGIDLRNIVPEEEYVNAWIKHFTPFILWNYDTSRKYLDVVDIACDRNPSLPYCKLREVRRKEPEEPENPFDEKFRPREDRTDNEEDISLELEETTTTRPRRYTTPVPLPRQNMLYTVLPSLQKEKDWRRVTGN
ncbi:hypothetical protein OESDEN_04778 [Oesophagostomum dentatum]|uniref:Uncharacterized protein n=1 Tax=Oesophagostomum dentatum TaxID=61180 RepID=A0A0B1THI9_OESDE|nr:hypothetical protein OESDEN_04778 [Oesophagostomum dentatum]